MRQIAEFVTVLSCAPFTGASVYITSVEHSARMLCGVEIAATEFVPSYRRATGDAGDLRSGGSGVHRSQHGSAGQVSRGSLRECCWDWSFHSR